jgi:hypothetical protein
MSIACGLLPSPSFQAYHVLEWVVLTFKMRYRFNVKREMRKEGLLVFFWNGCRGFFCDGAFGCAFSHDSEFCFGYVGAACKRVVAFSAFPDADALAFDSCEAALWACVGFFKTRGDSDVAFSDGRAVSGA